ncbi:hypothetical protein Syun_003231 [Stephania yunnanensis]|uniref:Uncharacterized protein n=1 Tax=Stephania yunnanensis TaxID=152371 RepID=A0AAP0L4N2_9MAGN
MMRSGSGDRYGSDNEGFIGDAPRLEKGHGTRESLDILLGKAISYNPQVRGSLGEGAKEKWLASEVDTLLERSLGKRIFITNSRGDFASLQFKPNQGMVTRRNPIYDGKARRLCSWYTHEIHQFLKVNLRRLLDKYKD